MNQFSKNLRFVVRVRVENGTWNLKAGMKSVQFVGRICSFILRVTFSNLPFLVIRLTYTFIRHEKPKTFDSSAPWSSFLWALVSPVPSRMRTNSFSSFYRMCFWHICRFSIRRNFRCLFSAGKKIFSFDALGIFSTDDRVLAVFHHFHHVRCNEVRFFAKYCFFLLMNFCQIKITSFHQNVKDIITK